MRRALAAYMPLQFLNGLEIISYVGTLTMVISKFCTRTLVSEISIMLPSAPAESTVIQSPILIKLLVVSWMLAANPKIGSLKISENTAAKADKPVTMYIGLRPSSKDKTNKPVIRKITIFTACTSPFTGIFGLRPYKWFSVFKKVLISQAKLSTIKSPVSLPISVASQGTFSVMNTGCRFTASMAAATMPTAVKKWCVVMAFTHLSAFSLAKMVARYLLQNHVNTRAEKYKIAKNKTAAIICATSTLYSAGIYVIFSIQDKISFIGSLS